MNKTQLALLKQELTAAGWTFLAELPLVDFVVAIRVSESQVKKGARIDLRCGDCKQRVHLMPSVAEFVDRGLGLLCTHCAFDRAQREKESIQ